MFMDQKTINAKNLKFKGMVKLWQSASENISTIGEMTGNDDGYAELRNYLDSEVFIGLKELFEIPKSSYALFNDEWFWLEWEPNDACFYYLLGMTFYDREKYDIFKNNIKRTEALIDRIKEPIGYQDFLEMDFNPLHELQAEVDFKGPFDRSWDEYGTAWFQEHKKDIYMYMEEVVARAKNL